MSASAFDLRPRRRHVPQPGAERRLVRPGPRPRRRRLLPDGIQLRPRPRACRCCTPATWSTGHSSATRSNSSEPAREFSDAAARLRCLGTGVAPPRRDRFWIFWGDPDHGIFQVNAPEIRGPWTAPAPRQGGQGDHRRLSPVGRGDRRGVPRARLGEVPLRRQEPAHRPSDAARRHRRCSTTARLIVDGDTHPRLVHARRARSCTGTTAGSGSSHRPVGVETGWQGAFRSRDVLRAVRGAGRPGAG